MVKNLPSVERSTKIRFGKNVPDSTEQEDNTIVFNASNVLVPTPYSNAVYLSPIRNKTDYQAPEIVLLMYDRNTKEITESGESANALIGGVTLNNAVRRSNATSNTVQFVGGGMLNNNTGFVTDSNIGISNLNPQHTVSVGSNLYIDDLGSNVLVVSGNVAILNSLVIDGNLRVNGDTSVIYTENTSIKDALIELGTNNGASDTTLDLGILMHRPDALSNVVIGYREGTDEFALAYTDTKPTDKTFTPKLDEDINVHVYGLTHVDANIYAHEDVLVDGNTYVTGNVSITEELTVSNNVYADKDLEVMGNVYVDGNVTIDSTTLHVDTETNRVGVGTITPKSTLGIVGNVHVTSNISTASNVLITGTAVATSTTTGALQVTGGVGIQGEVHSSNIFSASDTDGKSILGRVALGSLGVSGTSDQAAFSHIDMASASNFAIKQSALGTTHINAKSGQHIRLSVGASEKARMTSDGDFYVNTDTLYVDASESRIGIKTTSPGQSLDVRGDANVGVLTTTSGTVTDATQSTSKDTGVLVLTQGGLGVEANIHSTNVFAASHIGVGTSATSNTFDVRGTANVGALVTTSTHISDSTTASTKSSGALQVTGGTGIQGTLFAADTTLDSVKVLNMSTGTVPFTDASKKLVDSLITQNDDGSITISANVEIAGNISVVGNTFALTSNDVIITDRILDLANNNASSSLDIGIIMEHPGKNIFIGHHTSPDDHFSIGYTDEGYTADHVEWNGTKHITANIWGHLITQNTVTVQYGNVYIVDGGLGIGIGDGENDDVPDSKLYVTGNAHFTSNISTASNVLITGDATATSKTTGALQVTGGVGIGENIFVGGTGKIENTTDASSTTSGALQVLGGLGVVKSIHAADTTFESVNITDNTNSTDKDTGALIVQSGGAGIELNLNVGGVTKVWDGTNATDTTTGALQVVGGLGVAKTVFAADMSSGSVIVTDDTTSDSATTGALKVTGGVSTQENLNVGGTGKIWDATDAGATNQGALQVVGGLGVAKTVFAADMSSGSVIVTDDTTSDSATTGALKVTGGVSTQENLNVGGTGKIWDATDAGATNQGALQVVGGLGVAKTVFAADLSSGSVIVTDDTTSDSATTGALKVTGGVSTQENLNVGGVTKVWDATNATDTTTGALKVVGGLGVAKTVFAADMSSGSVIVTDDTTSTTATTGALKVTGGVSTQENLNVGGVTKVWDATNATDTTTGALKVVGGLGVAKTIFAADLSSGSVTVTDNTTSDSATTGALKVTGGVSTQENLNVGGVTKVWDATDAGATNQGALQVVGGLGVAKTVFAADMSSGSVTVTDTTTSDSATTGALKVAGGISTQENLNVGGDLKVDTSVLVVNSTTNRVGINQGTPGYTLDIGGTVNAQEILVDGAALGASPWDIETSPDALSYTDGFVGIGEATPDATLHVTGNAYVTTNLYASNVYTSGGLITNTAGTAKKTYSHAGGLPTNASIAQATFSVVFSNHVFQAKIYATLVEDTATVSSFSQDCCGGHITGGTPGTITLGPTTVVGHSGAPWDNEVTSNGTTVTFKANEAIVGAGYYDIFVEYLSSNADGKVVKFTEGGSDEITFNY